MEPTATAEIEALLAPTYYKGRYENAIHDIQGYLFAHPLAPDRNMARFFLARCLYETGKYSEARDWFVNVRSEFPKESEYWIRRCVAKRP